MSEPFEILGQEFLLVCPEDWHNSMRFWRDALGLEVASDWSDDRHHGVALKLGGTHVVLSDQEKIRDEELGFPIEPGMPYLYVKVKGLDALVEHLKSKNIPVLSGPLELHWGPRMASVKDPDGVPVMFVEWAEESDWPQGEPSK